MKEIEGDLIQLMKEFTFQTMAHGANCFCTMGSGIALQVKKEFPAAYEADLKTIKGDFNKLGNYTYADYRWNGQFAFRVINAYTQYNYGREKIQLDYEALTLVPNYLFPLVTADQTPDPVLGMLAHRASIENNDVRLLIRVADPIARLFQQPADQLRIAQVHLTPI
ncbi:MAG: hypothetical protein PHW73_12080 [Atribacterota bacterium]|nr:hypothetical protein [Atribacterota bacterium]